MKKIMLILMIILSQTAIADVKINEIMCNPLEGEEWIELYVSEKTNLSGLLLSDNSSTDIITCCMNRGCNDNAEGFVIVTTQNSNTSFNASILCVDDNLIGSRLNDAGDRVTVATGEGILDTVEYSSCEEGKSYSLAGGIWGYEAPTPGYENIAEECTSLVALRKEVFQAGADEALFSVNSTCVEENLTLHYNISLGESLKKDETLQLDDYLQAHYYFENPGTYSICAEIPGKYAGCRDADALGSMCNVSLGIKVEKDLFNVSEPVDYWFVLSDDSYDYSIEYWITDIDGLVLKDRYTTANTHKKTYTADASGAIILRANLTNLSCSDITEEDNYAEKLVAFTGKKPTESSIAIDEVYTGSDGTAKFGEAVRIRLTVYKGETSKNSISAWIEGRGEKISKISSFNVYRGFQEYELTIPIQVLPNCGRELPDGRYEMVAEGLNASGRKEIMIGGITESLCQKIKEQSATSKKSGSSSSGAPAAVEKKDTVEITDLREMYSPGENLSFLVMIENMHAGNATYNITAYLYRGSRIYSEKQELIASVPAKSKKAVPVTIATGKTLDGQYNVKARCLLQGQKTPIETSSPVSFSSASPLIKNFYTLNRKFSGNITLYASLDLTEENLSLVLDTMRETIISYPRGNETTFSAGLEPGKNIFSLKLLRGRDVIDTRELFVFVNESEIAVPDSPLEFSMYRAGLPPENMVTGAVAREAIYVSKDDKARSYSGYLVLLLAIVTAAGFYRLKRRQSKIL